jgi:hypothetical protein
MLNHRNKMLHSLFTHYKMQNYVVQTNEVDTVSKVKNGGDLKFLFSVSGGLPESSHAKVVQVNEY